MRLKWSDTGRDGRSWEKTGEVEAEFEQFRDSKGNVVTSNRVLVVDWEKCPSCGSDRDKRVFANTRSFRNMEVGGLVLCCGSPVAFRVATSSEMERFYHPSEMERLREFQRAWFESSRKVPR